MFSSLAAFLPGLHERSGILVEESFSGWKTPEAAENGVTSHLGWRFFSVGGARSDFSIRNSPDESLLRMKRDNLEGDAGIDRDTPDLRILVSPSMNLFIRIRVRKIGGDPALDVRIAEYENETFTGNDNRHLLPLSDQFRSCLIQVKVSSRTTEVNPAFRIHGTGTIEIERIEMGRMETAGSARPRILLPQGRTVNRRPALWWRGPVPAAIRVQLSPETNFSSISWDSGAIEKTTHHLILPPFTPDEILFVRVRIMDFSEKWSEWSGPTLIVYKPLPRLGKKTMVVYNLHPTRSLSPEEAFEQTHLVSALQGIVNRGSPNLFLRWMDADDFWLERLSEPGRWLENVRLEPIDDLETLLDRFSSFYKGVVLWDPEVPATSNVASTIAGVEDLLPVPLRREKGSLYNKIVEGKLNLPVKQNLEEMFKTAGRIQGTNEESCGSRKNNAYRWAISHYLESGKCNPARLGYYIDYFWTKNPGPGGDFSNHTLTNHDFFIMKRGFFWDLNVWPDETPIDDPGQPMGTDYETLLRMLRIAASRLEPGQLIHCGGFTPWTFKYTSEKGAGGKHGGVETEWETVRILSAFNAFLDADALHLSGLANASVYSHMPIPDRINQVPPPLPGECREEGWMDNNGKTADRTFIIHYVGDYDAASWLTTQGPGFWNNHRRGEVMLPWAWNPNLMERGMPMFDEYIRTRTPADPIWSGDSGAGYINPTQYHTPRNPSGLPDGFDRWNAQCGKWFRRLDIRHVGFVINGHAGAITDRVREEYRKFAGDGIVELDFNNPPDRLYKNMPVLPMKDIGLGADPVAAAKVVGKLARTGKPAFLPLRAVLRDPEFYRRLDRALRRIPELKTENMSPGEFFYVLRNRLGGKNEMRAAFLYDNCPEGIAKGDTLEIKVWLRNIGWDTWKKSGKVSTKVAVEFTEVDGRNNPVLCELPRDVAPGEMAEIPVQLKAPENAGIYFLRIDLVKGKNDWFSENGNLTECREIRIE